LWSLFGRTSGLSPDDERRVRAIEVGHHNLEDKVRDNRLVMESEVSTLSAMVHALREELHADRNARLELGTLNTEAILQGFKEASEGIVTRVLDSVWSKLALAQADVLALKTRVRSLELRGEDGK